MAKTFSEISVRISANMAELTKSLNKASGDLRKFNGDINKIAGAIGLGFGTQQIAQFTAEIVQLSGKAEGVAGAFNKLPNSIGLLNDLRTATKGTISDFELMQRTVQAFNLGIGIKEFPKLLEFATVRAQQTGEEIDYIVQSLVEGIGRKSVLKLDNLGISAERLRNKLGGVSMESATIAQVTSAFGQIAEEELTLMGSLADTAAVKISQLSSAWTDFKIELGKTVTPAFEPLIQGTTEYLKLLSSKNLSGFEKFSTILFPDPLSINISKLALKEYTSQIQETELANSGAAAATLYFKESLKSGKTASEASVISLENLNLLINDYSKEIQKANADKNFQFADRLKKNLKLITDAWTSTNTQLRKDTNANTIKTQSDADAASLENLIQKLKDYDRILRTLKVSAVGEQFRLIADTTTGKVFKQETPKQSGQDVLTRLGLNESKGTKSVEELFGKNISDQIEKLVKNANEGVAAMEKLKNAIKTANEEFSQIANQGITDFLVGLGDVAAGTVSFGDNILRAVSGFMKAFGQQLIKIGLGKIALDALFSSGIGGPLALAAGVALVAAAGAVSKNMEAKIRNPGTGWGGSGSSMAGNSGFLPSFNAGNQNITITGRLVGSGRDLVAVIDNTYFDNSMRKGG
jgi:hypothetical protein